MATEGQAAKEELAQIDHRMVGLCWERRKKALLKASDRGCDDLLHRFEVAEQGGVGHAHSLRNLGGGQPSNTSCCNDVQGGIGNLRASRSCRQALSSQLHSSEQSLAQTEAGVTGH